jgi:hypothetical protein
VPSCRIQPRGRRKVVLLIEFHFAD